MGYFGFHILFRASTDGSKNTFWEQWPGLIRTSDNNSLQENGKLNVLILKIWNYFKVCLLYVISNWCMLHYLVIWLKLRAKCFKYHPVTVLIVNIVGSTFQESNFSNKPQTENKSTAVHSSYSALCKLKGAWLDKGGIEYFLVMHGPAADVGTRRVQTEMGSLQGGEHRVSQSWMVRFWIVILNLIHPALKSQIVTVTFISQHRGRHFTRETVKPTLCYRCCHNSSQNTSRTDTLQLPPVPRINCLSNWPCLGGSCLLPYVQFSQGWKSNYASGSGSFQ